MATDDNAQTDLRAHAATYDGFISLLKYGAIASFLLGFIVILLIAS